MISDQSIEEVKNRIDIVDVISDFVNLKKAGQNYRGFSPFNDEKTPSFYVSPGKGLYKDFSSGKGGDAINFVMEHEGLDYLEVIRFLAKKFGVELEETETTDEARQAQNERESLLIILNFACEYFKDQLFNTSDGRNIGLAYFKERGLSEKIIKDFDLGYSLDKWDGLLNAAKENGHSEDLLEKGGLIVKKGDKIYDRFRARVIFPIHGLSGKPIAFGARTLSKEKNQPKYINSPETDVYHKSDILYGLFQSKNDIRKNDNCFLVEGYTDVISLHQSGIKNVVASSGTSLTEQQVRLIGRYTKNITVLFDGDDAGIQASLRGVDIILEKGLNTKIVILPEGEDPDSYVSSVGSAAFEKYIEEQATDFIVFKANYFAKKAGSDAAGKAEAIREVILSIVKIPDPIRRAVYIKESASLFSIDENILVTESNKILLEQRRKERKKEEYKTQREPELPPVDESLTEKSGINIDEVIKDQERECLRLLLNYGKEEAEDDYLFYEYFFEETEDITFLDPGVSSVLGHYVSAIEKQIEPNHEYFMEKADATFKNVIANFYFERYTISDNWELKHDITVLKETQMLEKVFQRNILLLKLRHTQKILSEFKQKLSGSGSGENEDEILAHYMEYKKIEMTFAKELGITVAR